MTGFHLFDDDGIQEESLKPAINHIDLEKKEDSLLEYLTFYICGDLFAVKLLDVREVIEMPKVKSVPKSDDHFSGLFNLRGEIAGLLSISKKFGLPTINKIGKNTPVVLFNSKNGPLGIIVDEMYKVFSCKMDQINGESSVRSKVPQKYLKGFIKKDEKFAIIIDLQLILDEDKITHFRKKRYNS